MTQPIPGKLSASITELVGDMIQDAIDDPLMAEYMEMMSTSPIIKGELTPSFVPSINPTHAECQKVLKYLKKKKKTKAQ